MWALQAGEGEDGRMKSAIGIGALLMDGLGDTIRVSLTEDPELEIVPCGCAHCFLWWPHQHATACASSSSMCWHVLTLVYFTESDELVVGVHSALCVGCCSRV